MLKLNEKKGTQNLKVDYWLFSCFNSCIFITENTHSYLKDEKKNASFYICYLIYVEITINVSKLKHTLDTNLD